MSRYDTSTKYQEWIDGIPGSVKNMCAEYTLKMQEAFPELVRVRGHYYDPFYGKRPHWWLKTPNGDIVDPTLKQFTPGGDYEEHDESRPEPTGKCPNCGEYCFNNKTCCSDKCNIEYAAYITRR